MNGTWLPRECVLGLLRAASRLKSARMVSGLACMGTRRQGEACRVWETQRRGLSWSAMVIVYASLWCMQSGTCTCSRDQTTSTGTVISTPWIPGEHRRGICAVECVTAHLRGFEEDSRSEVVFWIDEWSIEFGYHWLDVAHVHDHSPLSAPLCRY